MKQITRNLFTYQADIHASVEELANRLPHFTPLADSQRQGYGFVPVILDHESRVLKVPGGWVICLREDSKGVPAEEVSKKAAERVAEIKETCGRTVGKKELRDIKDQVLLELLPRAFTKTRRTHVLFSERTNHVYVNTGSQKVADLVMTLLVHSLESVKTSTVHVSEPKMGLTARLKNWLNDEDDSFGSFEPVSEVVLKDADRKWAVKADSLRNTQSALREAIEKSASVSSIGFMNEDGVVFRITDALRIKGVKHTVVEDDEDTDVHHCYVSQLASEIATLDGIMDELLELLSPEKAQAPKEDDTEDLF